MRTVAKGSWRRWAVGLAVVGLALGAWGLLARPSAVASEGGGEPNPNQEATLYLKAFNGVAYAATPWAGTRSSPTTLLCGDWTHDTNECAVVLSAWKDEALTDPEHNVTWNASGVSGRWSGGQTGHQVLFIALEPGVCTFTATTPDCSETIDVIFARAKLVEHLQVDEEGEEDPSYILCDSDGDFPFKFEIDGVDDGLVWVADDASDITFRFYRGNQLWNTAQAHLFASSWEATECDNGQARAYCFTVARGDMADITAGLNEYWGSTVLDVKVTMTVRRSAEETNVADVGSTDYVENVRYATSICRTIHVGEDEPLDSCQQPSEDFYEWRSYFDYNYPEPDPGFVGSPGDISVAHSGYYFAETELFDDFDWNGWPHREWWRACSHGGGMLNYALINFGLKTSPYWGTYLDVAENTGRIRPQGWAPTDGKMMWDLQVDGSTATHYNETTLACGSVLLAVAGMATAGAPIWVSVGIGAAGVLCSLPAAIDAIDDSDPADEFSAQAVCRWGYGREDWNGSPIAERPPYGGEGTGAHQGPFNEFPLEPGESMGVKVGQTLKAFVEWSVCAQNQSYIMEATPTVGAYMHTNVDLRTMTYNWTGE